MTDWCVFLLWNFSRRFLWKASAPFDSTPKTQQWHPWCHCLTWSTKRNFKKHHLKILSFFFFNLEGKFFTTFYQLMTTKCGVHPVVRRWSDFIIYFSPHQLFFRIYLVYLWKDMAVNLKKKTPSRSRKTGFAHSHRDLSPGAVQVLVFFQGTNDSKAFCKILVW